MMNKEIKKMYCNKNDDFVIILFKFGNGIQHLKRYWGEVNN